MKNPRGPIKGELKGRRQNLSKNRSGSFNADQTPAQFGNASPSLILGYAN